MAKIILEPNETFEHFHREDSYTILLAGRAVYSADGVDTMLETNSPILTPGMKSHTIKNTGSADCVIGCGHG